MSATLSSLDLRGSPDTTALAPRSVSLGTYDLEKTAGRDLWLGIRLVDELFESACAEPLMLFLCLHRELRSSGWPFAETFIALLLGMGVATSCSDELAGPRGRDPASRRLTAIPHPPEYAVAFTATPPTMDGVLDDAAWKRAGPTRLRNSFDGAEPRLKTILRVLYDGEFLYLSFDCEDPDVWGSFSRRDDPLYTQEVVELFVDAYGDGRAYQEIEVSPHNVVFDAYFPARRQGMDLSYDSGLTSAVTVDGTIDQPGDRDRGWRVEMRISLAAFAPVVPVEQRAGARWRFNAYRLELLDRKVTEGQSFSPLHQGDFHNLPRFGVLRFEPR